MLLPQRPHPSSHLQGLCTGRFVDGKSICLKALQTAIPKPRRPHGRSPLHEMQPSPNGTVGPTLPGAALAPSFSWILVLHVLRGSLCLNPSPLCFKTLPISTGTSIPPAQGHLGGAAKKTTKNPKVLVIWKALTCHLLTQIWASSGDNEKPFSLGRRGKVLGPRVLGPAGLPPLREELPEGRD